MKTFEKITQIGSKYCIDFGDDWKMFDTYIEAEEWLLENEIYPEGHE